MPKEPDGERLARLEEKHDAAYSLLEKIDKKMDTIATSNSKQEVEIEKLKTNVGWIKKVGATVLGASGAGGLWTYFTR